MLALNLVIQDIVITNGFPYTLLLLVAVLVQLKRTRILVPLQVPLVPERVSGPFDHL